MKKVKAGLIAPIYLSISWVLTVSYQIFTDTAVRTIAFNVDLLSPSVSAWLDSNIEVIVFVYAFTWIFVLSSVLPSVILGKERGIFLQYIVVLALTLLAFFMEDILALIGFQIQQLLDAATFLKNPFLAGIYLSVPYLLMIGLDLRSRWERKKKATEALEKPYSLTGNTSPEKSENPKNNI